MEKQHRFIDRRSRTVQRSSCWPSRTDARFNLSSLARFGSPNAFCAVYWLFEGVTEYLHSSCVCVSPCKRATTWVIDDTHKRIHRILFSSLVQLPKPEFLMSGANAFIFAVIILQISHLHLSHLLRCLSRPHTPPRWLWRAGEWFPLKRVRVETGEEERGLIGPERDQTLEPARLNAKKLRRDKRLPMEGKGTNTRVAALTKHANIQVPSQVHGWKNRTFSHMLNVLLMQV